MPNRMLVHDRRLAGTAPFIAQNTYLVNAGVATNHIIDWVGQYAKSQSGLDELLIMCHGYAVLSDARSATTYAEPVGATGLQLGNPGLTWSTVARTSAWKGNIGSIYLYACGVSASSMHDDPAFDGTRLCGELALYSGANVYAADQLQWYTGANPSGGAVINFGDWEGQVYCYNPNDGQGTPVSLGAQPMP